MFNDIDDKWYSLATSLPFIKDTFYIDKIFKRTVIQKIVFSTETYIQVYTSIPFIRKIRTIYPEIFLQL